MDRLHIVLTLAMGVSAALTMVGRERNGRVPLRVFQPLTTLLILLLAGSSAGSACTPYEYWILAGLLFGGFGDLFLISPEGMSLPGRLSFFIGHVFFAIAFTSGAGFRFPCSILVLLAVSGGIVFSFLRAHLRWWTTVPVLLYILVICLTALQAWARWQFTGGGRTLAAAGGASLFLVSDTVFGWHRSRRASRCARMTRRGTVFLPRG